MLRVDRAAVFLASTLSVASATCAGSTLELRGTGAAMRLELDRSGKTWMGIDGLMATSQRDRLPRSAKTTRLALGDSIDLAAAMPGEGEEPTLLRTATPCSLAGSSREKSPGTLYDFMLFGEASNQPWVRLECRDTSGWTRLPSLALRMAHSRARVRFPQPAIVRAPFLAPLLDSPVSVDSAPEVRWFRQENDSTTPRNGLTDSVDGWEWSVVQDLPGSLERFRIDARHRARRQPVWIMGSSGAQRALVFEDGYRREPRRAVPFRAPKSGKPHLAIEVSTLFGDGIRTDLWVVGPDTLLRIPIGERNGESGSEWKERWKIDPRRGTVLVTRDGRFQARFRAR